MKSTNKDKIYFPTDAATIIMGGKEYGGDQESLQANINTAKEEVLETVSAHTADTTNPHRVTKTQVGLGNVTNEAQVPLSTKGQANGVAELDANGNVKDGQFNTIYQSLKAKRFVSSYGDNVAGQQIDLSANNGIVVGERYKDETIEATTEAFTTITKGGVTVEESVISAIDNSGNYSNVAKLLPTGVEVGSTTLEDGRISVGGYTILDSNSLTVQIPGTLSRTVTVTGDSIAVEGTTINNGVYKTSHVTITPTSITIGDTTIGEDKLKKLLALIG